MRALPLPRYVNPATVEPGDIIRVTWNVMDVELTRMGKVGRVIDQGSYKLFVTPEGQEIARFDRNSKLKFTLLAQGPGPKQIPLFEMEGS